MIKRGCVCSPLCYYLPHEDKCQRATNTTDEFLKRGIESHERKRSVLCAERKAVPEVLLKVVEAKRLIESGKIASVQEATEKVGISRSSFINIKMIFFHFMTRQKEGRSH